MNDHPKLALKGHGEHKLSLQSGEDGGCFDKVPKIIGSKYSDHHHFLHHHLRHDQGVVIHEMLHNLGVVHEQNRPDRDSFLKIDWTNMPLDKVMPVYS